ncbi:hypothetical protein QBC34DRAFT_436809 [Podospora aff. communis PSN243]|uniref:Uncharacterized protein n=1 Tax=Podospora aff. communis PSN243 TaxID=3040156 RepID=A0AAV9GXG7_9PEZI|nr:hypothetical protein QBC34DRAFT_436809 [Podospora aff. communis PSN243]
MPRQQVVSNTTPPYTGPPPPSLTKPADLSFWTSVLAIDNATPNPPSMDAYLFYSGGTPLAMHLGALTAYIHQAFHRRTAPWPEVYPISSKKASPLRDLVDSTRDRCTPGLYIRCLSWAMARRAAERGGTVHVALWRGGPLCVKGSFWGDEAGILTGEGSKVSRIVRWDVEDESKPGSDEAEVVIWPGVVVWERGVNGVLGTPFGEQDWGREYVREGGEVVWEAEALVERGSAKASEGKGDEKQKGSLIGDLCKSMKKTVVGKA